mmetsp:Transcript_21118/g.31260  ORF Transcript_21118/g.31260 Transcript_21118/m.31260 type:complete len:285 (-) Transcript_21118:196-1050(-)
MLFYSASWRTEIHLPSHGILLFTRCIWMTRGKTISSMMFWRVVISSIRLVRRCWRVRRISLISRFTGRTPYSLSLRWRIWRLRIWTRTTITRRRRIVWIIPIGGVVRRRVPIPLMLWRRPLWKRRFSHHIIHQSPRLLFLQRLLFSATRGFLLSVNARSASTNIQTFTQCLARLCFSLFISHFHKSSIFLILLQEPSSSIPNNQNNCSCNQGLFLSSTKKVSRLKLLNQRSKPPISNLGIRATSTSTKDIIPIDIRRLIAYGFGRRRTNGFRWWIRDIKIDFFR